LALKFVAASMKGGKPPTCEASEYKLFGTQLSQHVADVALDLTGAAGQLRVRTAEAPMGGRFEGTYRATVVETVGGGSSEIQKNIIAQRKLGLPRTY
jgi:alkylation response protein AidB-like acyl-CoA dehydrogenase